jgi:hypothetical protein
MPDPPCDLRPSHEDLEGRLWCRVCVRNVNVVSGAPGGDAGHVICPIEGAAVPLRAVLRP